MESEITREKRIVIMLFVPLIIIGLVFYNMSGHSMAVLCSGIIALMLYAWMVINKYYRSSFSKELHWWLCLSVLVAGVVFLFTTISAIEKIK